MGGRVGTGLARRGAVRRELSDLAWRGVVR